MNKNIRNGKLGLNLVKLNAVNNNKTSKHCAYYINNRQMRTIVGGFNIRLFIFIFLFFEGNMSSLVAI